MTNMLALPPELLLEVAKRCSIQSIGRLSQISKIWAVVCNDIVLWLDRIHRELTLEPKLRYGESYKEYYENVYDYKVSPHLYYGPSVDLNGDNYKYFLTRPIAGTGAQPDPRVRHSLQAYFAVACRIGAEVWAATLIQLGAVVNTEGEDESPLMIATRNGHVPLIGLLTSEGANINFVTSGYQKRTVFQAALQSPNIADCLQALINSKQNPRIIPKRHRAIIFNQTKLLEESLTREGNHSKLDRIGLSAVGWAIILGRTDCIKILIDHKVSLDHVADNDYMSTSKRNQCGEVSAILFAIDRRRSNILALLLERVGLQDAGYPYMHPSYSDIRYISLLELATKKDFPAGVQLLLRAGARANRYEALCIAASRNFQQCLGLLQSGQGDVNQPRVTAKHEEKHWKKAIQYPLTLATKSGHTASIISLLHNGADPNLCAAQKKGSTRRSFFTELQALKDDPRAHAALEKTRYDQVDTDVKNISPLIYAVRFLISVGTLYHCSFFKELSGSHTLNEDIKHLQGKIANNKEILLEFDQDDYDPRNPNNHLSRQALTNIKVLLLRGADPNHSDSKGDTAIAILLSGIKKDNTRLHKNINKLILCAIATLLKHGAKTTPEQMEAWNIAKATNTLIAISKSETTATELTSPARDQP